MPMIREYSKYHLKNTIIPNIKAKTLRLRKNLEMLNRIRSETMDQIREEELLLKHYTQSLNKQSDINLPYNDEHGDNLNGA